MSCVQSGSRHIAQGLGNLDTRPLPRTLLKLNSTNLPLFSYINVHLNLIKPLQVQSLNALLVQAIALDSLVIYL